ncbi:25701_t:CDS:1, partial [Racocetra persica]
DIHKQVNYRKTYVTINGLSKKAIQTGIDAGSNTIQELENFMNSFITKYTSKKKETPIHKKNKRQHEYENETSSSYSSSDEEGFIAVENPIVRSKRGASRKKRLKGFHEFESKNKKTKEHSEIPKGRKLTQCQQCQNTGYNRAGCEA